MDAWDFLSLLWVPCLAIGFALQIRALYLKRIMVKKYGFRFPQSLFKPVHLGELKTNQSMTESQSLKVVISKFIFSKKWFYRFTVAAIFIIVVPALFKFWLASSVTHK